MKNANDTIGNRSRDLPTCSAMPQPTAPTRAPLRVLKLLYLSTKSTPKKPIVIVNYICRTGFGFKTS